MKQRLRILVSLVEQHINDIYFLVDIDYTYIQVFVPRIRWLRLLGYEININKAFFAIKTLLLEEIDKSAKPFDTYDVFRSKVDMELKTTLVLKKKDKLVKKLKARFAEGTIEDEEDDDEEEEAEQDEGPLALTQGMEKT